MLIHGRNWPWDTFVYLGFLLTVVLLAGCAQQSEWTRSEQESYQRESVEAARETLGEAHALAKERGIGFQLLIRNSALKADAPELADRAWRHYQESRRLWREGEDRTGLGMFPAEDFYNPAIAYFSGIGQSGRVLRILEDAAEDSARSSAFSMWRRYQLRAVREATRIGNGPKAVSVINAMADRYRVSLTPAEDMDEEDKAWSAYLLSKRYKAVDTTSYSEERIRRDARFVLDVVATDDQFQRAYFCCSVPAIPVLSPFLSALAQTGDEELYDRVNDLVESARQRTLELETTRDLTSPTGRSLFFNFGNELDQAAGLLNDAIDNWGSRTTTVRYRSWPLFRLAMVRWDANLRLGREKAREKRFAQARERMAAIESVYEVRGSRQAAADGVPRARQSLRLAHAREAELDGQYNKAIRAYKEVVAWSERVRESLPVNQRLYFFRGSAKPAYLGLIRSLARLSEEGGGVEDDLLAAIQSYRGRQLLEQIPGSRSAHSEVSLGALQGRLDRAELRLILLDLETKWLAVLIDHSRMRIALQAQAGEVRKLARSARDQLVNGGDGEGRTGLLPALLGDHAALVSEYDSISAVTDGLISLVPLEALYLNNRPLVVSHEIRYLPTISGVAAEHGAAASQRALIVADPAYAVAKNEKQPNQTRMSAVRASNDSGYFTQLPETREEAVAVKAALDNYESRQLMGKQATELGVRSELKRNPSVVHFATHGILSGDLPGLNEAALVLAHSGNADGLLTASEISELSLNAELAVLSACNTGNGEQVAGEGLVGVSRAFLTGGTKAVVASMWPVDSEATVKLMEAFYKELGAGRPPVTALRQAKLDLRKAQIEGTGGLRALKSQNSVSRADGAYFWSPFILVTLG